MIFYWLFFAFLQIGVQSSDSVENITLQDIFDCPSKESLGKCDCKNLGLAFEVFCKQVEVEDLNQTTIKFKSIPLRKLEISEFNASTLPASFDTLQVEALILNKVEVDDISVRNGQNLLHGLEDSLEVLEITESFRNEPNHLIHLELYRLHRLLSVVFEDNHIPEIKNDWFLTGPKSISDVILRRNGIQILGDQVFYFLENLKLLTVSGNTLSSIKRSMLPRLANKLTVLDLSNNKLIEIPHDFFRNMPNLQEVSIYENLFHTLKEETWSKMWPQLKRIIAEGNPIECDDKIRWICLRKKDIALGTCSTSSSEETRKTLQQFCETT